MQAKGFGNTKLSISVSGYIHAQKPFFIIEDLTPKFISKYKIMTFGHH